MVVQARQPAQQQQQPQLSALLAVLLWVVPERTSRSGNRIQRLCKKRNRCRVHTVILILILNYNYNSTIGRRHSQRRKLAQCQLRIVLERGGGAASSCIQTAFTTYNTRYNERQTKHETHNTTTMIYIYKLVVPVAGCSLDVCFN